MEKIYRFTKSFTYFQCKIKEANLFLLIILSAFTFELPAQQSYTFTNCGATGRLGPTQTQVSAAYIATNLSLVATTTPTSGIQTWTVPSTGLYRITALGASGGDATSGPAPGYGASMAGDFNLLAGEVIQILVGQAGQDRLYSGGGGGATYVIRTPYNTNASILVIAGGGGASSADFAGLSAVTATCGTFDVQSGPAQCAGSGGLSFTSNSGSGGGGFFGTGQNGGIGTGGTSYTAGGYGGLSNNQQTGGFGGGGGQDGTGTYAGSGGGGYSGGNGGNRNSTSGTGRMGGGGGGSLNNGTNQINAVLTATGHGRVLITELCNISIYASGSNSTAPTICSGNSLTLTTNAASNYTWSTGNSTSTVIVVSPTSSTTYSIIGTSSLNCVASTFINVTVSSGLPVLSITNNSANICLGQSVSLSASGALSYTWTNPGVVNGQTFTPSATAVYTVLGQNGCGISTSTTAIVVAPLSVSVLASPTLVCEGYPSTLTAQSSVGNYTWQPGALPGQTVIVTPTVNTIYTVSATDGTCSGTQTLQLNTKPTPTITATASASMICEGIAVNLSASGAGAGGTYSWSPSGGSGPSIAVSPTISTLYNVAGTNSVNCTASAQQVVVVNSAPPLTVAAIANKTLICSGESASLTAAGASSYLWTNGPATAGYVVTPTAASNIYTVTGSQTSNTCTSTRTIAVNVIIPNVTLTASVSVCTGSSAVLTASGATSYSWNGFFQGANGSTTVSPVVSTTYSLVAFTVVNTVSCSSTHTSFVKVNPNPTLTVAATKSLTCRLQSNTLTANGAQTYSWGSAGSGSAVVVNPSVTTQYTVTGTDANGCLNSMSIFANVSSCSGLSNLERTESLVLIYPNPNSGSFTIKVTEDMDLNLYNELGQVIGTFVLNSLNDHEIKLSTLPKGIYLLSGDSGSRKANQKIIVAE